jgi:hypothetical protein
MLLRVVLIQKPLPATAVGPFSGTPPAPMATENLAEAKGSGGASVTCWAWAGWGRMTALSPVDMTANARARRTAGCRIFTRTSWPDDSR